MQVKTTQKLSRSAVATVLATSSVALGLPVQTNAAELFKDVKPTDFFYTAVNELAEKKIIGGYGDGTFRPYKNVTRGEAAKMLALSLKLDVANAATSQFSDVKKSNPFYNYIAALANKGIISGYPDGTFKPNEVVQRGSMAKMVALGYQFTLATNTTHPFKDVDQKNIFNQHIQTLVNLNITKGTSFNTFEPGKAVTRGELATFISRASKANAGKPIYVVDNIIGNKVYINSVGYTIGSNVARYIKPENKSALIGAHIEGTFNGMTLTNVTKLTLNATGNANSIYTFDGGDSTYTGTLVVNGSYLKFKNWTLNGQTIVSETPRKSLAQYNRLSEIKIASLASGFIDFTRPTNPDDGNLNDGSNSGSLNSGTSTPPYAPYSEKLTQIHKYVDFTNVTVRNLFVEQNRAYIAAQKEIAMVTVRRDVEFAELNFNMRNLYIEGDESLTLYGTHDIVTVYKNSYYSVYFNSNSEINTLIVDNSNGWIDLGDYVVIDQVIIPPKTTPNDIFDDYKNDNDKIGNIEDNTGEEVDRNPIENGIVPDVDPADIYGLDVQADSNKMTATLTVSEEGIAYFLVKPEEEPAPTAREVYQTGRKVSVTSTDQSPDGRYTTTLTELGLEPVKKYKLYVVHADNSGNFSPRIEEKFETKDGTAPYFKEFAGKGLPGGRRIELTYQPNEAVNFYYYVTLGNAAGSFDPDFIIKNSIEEIELDKDDVIDKQKIIITHDGSGQQIQPLTTYIIYGVLVDESGNVIEEVKVSPSIKTEELDDTPPYVVGPNNTESLELVRADNGKLNEFFMYFSERLDKESAEKVENYTLTGTGIINVPDQKSINPTEVKYYDEGNRGKVLLKIPSLTGFIHGDSLKVTVSKDVKDLADNYFEYVGNVLVDKKPRNYATYYHDDKVSPLLKITDTERNMNDKKAIINFNASKAGTLYYMVLPSSIKLSDRGITTEDFVAEFGPDPTDKFNINGNSSNGKIYLEGNLPKDLKNPLLTELGDNQLIYDYKDLRPNSSESYTIHMVLKDRSGNLSNFDKEIIIADDVPPEISFVSVEPTINRNDSVDLNISSVNEGGNIYYGYAPKYIKKDGKFILNPDIYRDGELIGFGNLSSTNSALNKDDFINNVPNLKTDVLLEGSNPTIRIDKLNKNEEYVFFVGVEDIFNNFTVYQKDKTKNNGIMSFVVYTDGIAPYIINNRVVRDLNDPKIYAKQGDLVTDSPTFTLTFSESLMLDYQYSGDEKQSLDKVSKLDIRKIEEVLKIEDTSKPIGDVNRDITDKFVIEKYTEATPIAPYSQLVIRPTNRVYADKSFEVTMLAKDHQINENKPNEFKLPGKYIYTNINSHKYAYATLQDYTTIGTVSESKNLKIGLDLKVDATIDTKFYYAVYNSEITDLDEASLKTIVFNADAGNSKVPLTGLTVFGSAVLESQSDGSFTDVIEAKQSGNGITSVFRKGHRLFLFTLDEYGNVVWALDEKNGNRKYYEITID